MSVISGMGFIYKITNTENPKVYIGRTTAENPYRRWTEHKSKARSSPRTPIEFAIRKYGHKKFKFEVLETGANEFLPALETSYILSYSSIAPKGYNLEFYQPMTILNQKTLDAISVGNQGQNRKTVCTSKYIGVNKWQKSFSCEIAFKRTKYKKRFPSELKCAIAYDKMALYLYGKNAKINFESKRVKWTSQKLFKFYRTFVYKRPIEERGLFYDTERKKWLTRIFYKKKRIYVGRFSSRKLAVEERVKKMKELRIYDKK